MGDHSYGGGTGTSKVPITSRARLSFIYLVVSSLSVIKPKINESPVSIMIKISCFYDI